MNDVITIGVDLAKNVFQIHGVDAEGTYQLVVRWMSVVVKGCRTPAVTGCLRRARSAGVGQASGEETAGGSGSMARPVRSMGI